MRSSIFFDIYSIIFSRKSSIRAGLFASFSPEQFVWTCKYQARLMVWRKISGDAVDLMRQNRGCGGYSIACKIDLNCCITRRGSSGLSVKIRCASSCILLNLRTSTWSSPDCSTNKGHTSQCSTLRYNASDAITPRWSDASPRAHRGITINCCAPKLPLPCSWVSLPWKSLS
jgi:hypothetical protein